MLVAVHLLSVGFLLTGTHVAGTHGKNEIHDGTGSAPSQDTKLVHPDSIHPIGPRALWPTVRRSATESAPVLASVSSSSAPATTLGATSTVIDYTESYIIFPNSAINMAGQSYYVNYNTPTGSLLEVMAICFNDVTCVAFDYTVADQQGWMHRIGRECAAAAGAQFVDGTTSASNFYELKPEILEARGINASQCSSVKSSYEVDLKPANMVGRVFAASLGTFIVTGLLLGGVWKFMHHREHERLIARVINQNAVLEDDELRRPLQHINEVYPLWNTWRLQCTCHRHLQNMWEIPAMHAEDTGRP
eukprot:m.403332 g.403332  ORF g.403332 m.403332 type:complete len:304 (+) comp21191_c1_seq43:180-1091(+)